MRGDRYGRTLKTARAVLQVLKILARSGDGVRAEDIARSLGKSTPTATYLLNSLCREGFAQRGRDGRYRLAEPLDDLHPPDAGGDLSAATEELYDRTNERTYLATADDHDVTVHESRGRQGLPTVPGLRAHIGGQAHAVAVGKAVLAHAGPEAIDRYRDRYGLEAFTPATISGVTELERELATVRERGFAVDREEFAEGFCCIAAPLFDADGALCGALALSTTVTRFRSAQRRLVPIVTAVARASGGRPAVRAPDRRAAPLRAVM